MTIKKNILRTLILSTTLFASASVYAWHGGGFHGGGFHGGGWHGGGWHGGGWHGGGWHGGTWQGGGWYGGGAPVYHSGCGTIRVCNQYGSCWLENSCY